MCRVFGIPKSTHYSHVNPPGEAARPPKIKPGPKTPQTDEELLDLIRAYLANSIFVGEGHRGVTAGLRAEHGITIGSKRILRIMRMNSLLSSCRPKLRAMAKPKIGKPLAPGYRQRD
ncbi:MAG: IS3 family transposase [Polyangiaceae bacterium]|nr:IS3 family transposase [Polyangiaceae bacterium]